MDLVELSNIVFMWTCGSSYVGTINENYPFILVMVMMMDVISLFLLDVEGGTSIVVKTIYWIENKGINMMWKNTNGYFNISM